MASAVHAPDLWHFVQSQHWLDPDDLFEATIHQAQSNNNDYRTQLLSNETYRNHATYNGTSLPENASHYDTAPT
jgi:hypothetical protein